MDIECFREEVAILPFDRAPQMELYVGCSHDIIRQYDRASEHRDQYACIVFHLHIRVKIIPGRENYVPNSQHLAFVIRKKRYVRMEGGHVIVVV